MSIHNDPHDQQNTLHSRVVVTAEKLFRARGFSTVTVEEIASEIGISKKTLYTVVRSKEQILNEIIEASLRQISDRIDGLFDQRDLSFVEKAAGWFVFLQFIHDTLTPTELISDIQRNAPNAWKLVKVHSRNRVARITSFFSAGRTSGEVRSDLDPAICARLYSSCSAGILDESILAGVKLQRKRAFEVFGQLFYTGMFTSAARLTLEEVRAFGDSPESHSLQMHPAGEGDKVRSRILQAGRRQFFRLGYSKVRMDEIASDIGISKKTLYNHFSSKEDLLREVIKDFAVGIADATIHVSDESVFEYIRSLRIFVIAMANRLSELTPQFVRDLSRSAPEFVDEMLVWRSDAIDHRFASVLQRGQKLNAIRSDVSSTHLARVYRIVLESALHPEELAQEGILPVDMYRTIVNAMFIGILEDDHHAEFALAYAANSSTRKSSRKRVTNDSAVNEHLRIRGTAHAN